MQSSTKPFVVVGVPAFNEEKAIAKVILEVQRYADGVVICDDGSTDLTADIAERLGACVIRHGRNLGYGAAIKSLFRRAKELGAYVLVTLDADGRRDPSEILRVVGPVVEGKADVAVGSRFVDDGLAYKMPWYRRAGVKLITKLTDRSAKNGIRDAQSGFRAYSRGALEVLDFTENGMGASVEILLEAQKHGLKVKEVPASCRYDNKVKSSTHNPIRHGWDILISIVRYVVEKTTDFSRSAWNNVFDSGNIL